MLTNDGSKLLLGIAYLEVSGVAFCIIVIVILCRRENILYIQIQVCLCVINVSIWITIQ
jgi:hypothetical protein